jgi:hypothetical protein
MGMDKFSEEVPAACGSSRWATSARSFSGAGAGHGQSVNEDAGAATGAEQITKPSRNDRSRAADGRPLAVSPATGVKLVSSALNRVSRFKLG